MTQTAQLTHMKEGNGFIAALDQSGGSTPKALKLYGISEDSYNGEEEMFALMHQMRTRMMTAPAFNGDKIIGAILYEKTMDNTVNGQPVPEFLWQERSIVPFLKVDKGLAAEEDGVSLMKPMPELESLLTRAREAGIFGTKMRSTIRNASKSGIAAVVTQQFEVGHVILNHGLYPIIEPEVLIDSPEKKACEEVLKAEILTHLDRLNEDQPVLLKLTIPEQADFYMDLINHPRVIRVVALSGGYSKDDACQRLSENHGMIASFSRALTQDLNAQQSDDAFNQALAKSIDQIYNASVSMKQAA